VRPAATVNPPTLRHRWLVALVCGWILAVLAAAAGASADPWSGIGRVRAPGGPFLRDAHGRRLQLHGVDLVAKCGGGARPAPAAGTPCIGSPSGSQPAFVLSPTASDPGRRFTAADAATLQQLGFAVVRLGIVWQGLEPGPAHARPNDPRYCARHRAGTAFPRLGSADPYRASAVSAYLASTDRIVALLAHAGLRVILDMHQDAYGSAFSEPHGTSPWNGEGAPPWATCTDGRVFAGRPYWGLAYTASVVQTAIGHFWHNDVRADLQAQFARVWQAVARHYRGDPDVLGYEVFNEPTEFSIPDFTRELQCALAGPGRAPRSCAGGDVQALRTGLIGAIEAADPTRLVFVEPVVTAALAPSRALGVREPLRFGRLVLAVHVYGIPPAGVFGCPSTVCQGSERRLLARLVAERARMRTLQPGGPAMILDEFGGGPSIPDIAQVADMANRASLSWTYWSALQLHDPTGAPGENLLNDRTAQPWPAKAQVLAGPYPLATAGTPGPVAFEPASRSFGFTYTVDRRVRAPTEIVVPPYTYPQGYGVVVQGATVTSVPDAPLLTLRPLPGSHRVSVLLAAASG
jgi:endoglycosylceramidase